jgi:hypothetical protein
MPSYKYKVSLKLPDKVYSKSAPTVLEAIEKLPRPVFFKSKAIFELKSGKQKSEVYMWPHMLRKLFVNPMSRALLSKRLTLALK